MSKSSGEARAVKRRGSRRMASASDGNLNLIAYFCFVLFCFKAGRPLLLLPVEVRFHCKGFYFALKENLLRVKNVFYVNISG